MALALVGGGGVRGLAALVAGQQWAAGRVDVPAAPAGTGVAIPVGLAAQDGVMGVVAQRLVARLGACMVHGKCNLGGREEAIRTAAVAALVSLIGWAATR